MTRTALYLVVIVFAASNISAQPAARDEADELARQVSRLYAVRKFGEALPIAKRVVDIRRRLLGESSLKTGEAIRALAYVQLGLDKLSDARQSLDAAIRIYTAVNDLPPTSRDDLGTMLERLGLLKFDKGDDSGAVESFSAAVGQREKAFGADSPQVGQSVWLLATVQYARKEFGKAENNYWKVLEIRARQFGYGSWEVEEAKIRYNCAATKSGNKEEMNARLSAFSEQSRSSEPEFRAIHGGVVNGKAISLEKPEFPVSARHAVPTGNVTVWVTVDEGGKVVFACAISGDRVFWDVSENAAYRSKFLPTTLGGKPAKVLGLLVYAFRY